MQIIIVNVAVFVFINLIYTLTFLINLGTGYYEGIIKWLAVPAGLSIFITRPWTLMTYMFLHEDLLHILFNMLWLFWIGKILEEYLGNKKLISTYILGGICGGALYIISFNIFPAFREVIDYSYALGASAGVLAVIVATATLLPDYTIHLLFLGPVRLKYIAAFSILLDLIYIPKGNAGGHIAHLGGAIFGFIYIKQLQGGKDISNGFNNLIDTIKNAFSPKSDLKVSYKNKGKKDKKATNSSKQPNQDIIDSILDKIAQSGYDSLSKEEKDILFKASKDD